MHCNKSFHVRVSFRLKRLPTVAFLRPVGRPKRHAFDTALCNEITRHVFSLQARVKVMCSDLCVSNVKCGSCVVFELGF